jgi:hypothetical protein
MITATKWHKAYTAAVLETDWTKMEGRILAAESAIREREHEFSLNHGGTPEERQAIANALNGLRSLSNDAIAWSRSTKRA